MDTLLYIAQMLALGVGVGILSAALGLGGGILMVPTFITFVGMDPNTAKGTSLFLIIFIAILNAWRLNKGLPEKPWRTAGLLGLGSLLGSYTAARITSTLSDQTVLIIFIALLAVIALRTFFLKPREVSEKHLHKRKYLAIGIGFLAGLYAGATGTGGGALMIPLVLIAGISVNARVVGLSMMVMIVTSIAGSIAHLQAENVFQEPWTVGQVYLPLALLVLPGVLIGRPLGNSINNRITIHQRKAAMGILLLVICAMLGYRLITPLVANNA